MYSSLMSMVTSFSNVRESKGVAGPAMAAGAVELSRARHVRRWWSGELGGRGGG